jgi:flagellar biosynthesis/type III secretory pathway protein FliH
VLHPVRPGDPEFANTDWDQVPRLDYRSEKFRQLAVPNPARVVDDPSEFEPWKPLQLGDLASSETAKTDPKSRTDFHGETPSESLSQAQQADTADGVQGQTPDATAFDTAETDTAFQGDPIADPRDAATDSAVHEEPSTVSETAAQTPDEPSQDVDADSDAAPGEAPQAAGDESLSGDSPIAEADTPTPEPGLDSAAVQEACDAARQTGLEEGLEQGRNQGREEAQAQAQEELQAALEKAEADKAQALQALRDELTGEIDPVKRQLNKATEQIESLIAQPDKLYEHVKRLSLHLAEQLVLGELNLSSAAIERLIQRSLDELDLHGNHVVTVELNPQDKARLQERAGELSHGLSLQAVSSMQPGSVRVMINDTMVEDLVGNRLDALARSLLVQPEAWREQSPFFRQPLAQRDTEVQDAPARVATARETVPVAEVDDASNSPIDVEPMNADEDLDMKLAVNDTESTDHPGDAHD